MTFTASLAVKTLSHFIDYNVYLTIWHSHSQKLFIVSDDRKYSQLTIYVCSSTDIIAIFFFLFQWSIFITYLFIFSEIRKLIKSMLGLCCSFTVVLCGGGKLSSPKFIPQMCAWRKVAFSFAGRFSTHPVTKQFYSKFIYQDGAPSLVYRLRLLFSNLDKEYVRTK